MLESLYEKLLPWIKQHPNHGLYMDTDRPVCPNCGSEHVIKKGLERTQTMVYRRYRCGNCQTPIKGRKNLMDSEQKDNILTQSK